MEIIKLDLHGRAYSEIAFKPHNHVKMIQQLFKIDTGADISTISKKYLYRLGYNERWIIENAKPLSDSTMASGELVTNYIVQLPLLNIYGYEALNWPFAILLDETTNNGSIKYRTHTKTFKRRKPFRLGQEVHTIQN